MIKKIFINMLCAFVPSRSARHNLRNKFIVKESVHSGSDIVKIGGGDFAKSLGFNNCFIYPTTEIADIENLTIGNNTWIGGECKIYTGKAGIIIGNNVSIAFGNIFLTNNHNYKSKKLIPFDEINYSSPIEIEDCVWIGAGCIILGGIKIGKGAIIGAGSVLTKSVPECAIVAGNPAKIIGWRDKEIFDKLNRENKFLEIGYIQEEIVKNEFKPYLEERK